MLLSFNTCGRTATVALGIAESDKVKIIATAELAARTYSASLMPEIAALLEKQKATLHDVEAIVVVNGPGSFTGIRVGVSTAKGLAEGAGIPLIAVSRLALLADSSGLPHVLAAVDAGRVSTTWANTAPARSWGRCCWAGKRRSRPRACQEQALWFATRAARMINLQARVPPWQFADRFMCSRRMPRTRSVSLWAAFAPAISTTPKRWTRIIFAAPMPRFCVLPEPGCELPDS